MINKRNCTNIFHKLKDILACTLRQFIVACVFDRTFLQITNAISGHRRKVSYLSRNLNLCALRIMSRPPRAAKSLAVRNLEAKTADNSDEEYPCPPPLHARLRRGQDIPSSSSLQPTALPCGGRG